MKAGTERTRPNLDQQRIGPRLREIRQARGITLSEVAAGSGLSKGFISLLERNETAPSVASLLKICDFLGVRVSALLDTEAPASVVRHADRGEDLFGGFGVTDAVLTPSDQRHVQVIESEIDPGGASGDELHSFDADAEVIVVLQGMLEVRFAEERFRIGRGDAMTISPREPHAWVNPSTTRRAKVLWIITPRSL